jgi:hypothetical protein
MGDFLYLCIIPIISKDMLVDYIKDIINNDKWDVKLTDGKYIVKQIIDCKECSLTRAARETGMLWVVVEIKEKLKHYLPKDVIYEVEYELINPPKPKIRLYSDTDMAKKADTYINVHRTHDRHLGSYISWDTNVPVIRDAGMV